MNTLSFSNEDGDIYYIPLQRITYVFVKKDKTKAIVYTGEDGWPLNEEQTSFLLTLLDSSTFYLGLGVAPKEELP